MAGQAGQTALQELNSKNFKSFLEEAGSTLVVVDFYTDWWAHRWNMLFSGHVTLLCTPDPVLSPAHAEICTSIWIHHLVSMNVGLLTSCLWLVCFYFGSAGHS